MPPPTHETAGGAPAETAQTSRSTGYGTSCPRSSRARPAVTASWLRAAPRTSTGVARLLHADSPATSPDDCRAAPVGNPGAACHPVRGTMPRQIRRRSRDALAGSSSGYSDRQMRARMRIAACACASHAVPGRAGLDQGSRLVRAPCEAWFGGAPRATTAGKNWGTQEITVGRTPMLIVACLGGAGPTR